MPLSEAQVILRNRKPEGLNEMRLSYLASTGLWTAYWWWWLLAILVSWLIMELLSIAVAHATGQRHFQEWTLSDTIRRWSASHRWLAPIITGCTTMLLYHFLIQTNLP